MVFHCRPHASWSIAYGKDRVKGDGRRAHFKKCAYLDVIDAMILIWALILQKAIIFIRTMIMKLCLNGGTMLFCRGNFSWLSRRWNSRLDDGVSDALLRAVQYTRAPSQLNELRSLYGLRRMQAIVLPRQRMAACMLTSMQSAGRRS